MVGSQWSNYRSPLTDYRLPITRPLPITDHRFCERDPCAGRGVRKYKRTGGVTCPNKKRSDELARTSVRVNRLVLRLVSLYARRCIISERVNMARHPPSRRLRLVYPRRV